MSSSGGCRPTLGLGEVADICKVENQSGEIPEPRFGHTTTYVGNHKIVLFGGATGDAGSYNITADTYLFDLSKNYWIRIHADNCPHPRAAHASACVEQLQLLIFGGAIGGGALSSDELYLLDLRKETNLQWIVVPVTGASPGRRYGHSMSFVKPNLIVFGGNDGQSTVNDVWNLDVEKSPFCWIEIKLLSPNKQPEPRVYHSAEVCKEGPASGMVVIFGGRTIDNRSLKDTWGLRQHRDGRWDWVLAPTNGNSQLPAARYQHCSVFVGPKLVVIGGRSDLSCTESLSIAVYDTETTEWRNLPSVGIFRHSVWSIKNAIFIFGGFTQQRQQQPTSDLYSINCTLYEDFYSEKEKVEIKKKQLLMQLQLPNAYSQKFDSASSIDINNKSPQQVFHSIFPLKPKFGQLPSLNLSSSASNKYDGEIRLSSHAHAVQESPTIHDFSAFIRKISIDKLEDEGKKINKSVARNLCVTNELNLTTMLHDRIVKFLLKPNITPSDMSNKFHTDSIFPIPWEDINYLCQAVLDIVKEESMILQLRAPIKIYGDIHGQYYDLMRLFRLYKCPVEEDLGEVIGVNGDIDSNDYLFLGDYVDRGTNSLEAICLLFALKCKYPRRIHLIRGNHEDMSINAIYGFQDECKRRLRENPTHQGSCWHMFNQVFEWLPVGGLIEDKILCIHGGIGGSIHKLSDISDLQRPLKVVQIPRNEYEQRITDLLWSDPTDSDSILGVQLNDVRDPDGTGKIVKFGPDRVHFFLNNNNLSMIIRAHECVMDGFERFAGGKLLTVFSATNYCNHYKNAGALLFVCRGLTVTPKLIYPFNADAKAYNTWDTRLTSLRPPTPPRSSARTKQRI